VNGFDILDSLFNMWGNKNGIYIPNISTEESLIISGVVVAICGCCCCLCRLEQICSDCDCDCYCSKISQICTGFSGYLKDKFSSCRYFLNQLCTHNTGTHEEEEGDHGCYLAHEDVEKN
jgi:hypothetical protein